MTIEVHYTIAGKPIILEDGEDDGIDETEGFDYEVEVSADDIIDYMGYENTVAVTKAIQDLLDNDLIVDLQDDDNFVSYLKEKYEKEAYERSGVSNDR